jgi:hypothetical protein
MFETTLPLARQALHGGGGSGWAGGSAIERREA